MLIEINTETWNKCKQELVDCFNPDQQPIVERVIDEFLILLLEENEEDE